jgi:hypothetical protein
MGVVGSPVRPRAAVAGWRWVAVAVFAVTVVQLLVATAAPGLPQFRGKAFGARLAFYPVLMLSVPALWWVVQRRRPNRPPAPWEAFALLMAPFAIDVTGNTADLYDSVAWWDDANHLVNWFLLCLGAGRLLARGWVGPRWALGLLIAGLGALLAIGWELGEWYTFIRHGTELATAYTDTLGDEALGCLGAAAAAVVIAAGSPPAPRA